MKKFIIVMTFLAYIVSGYGQKIMLVLDSLENFKVASYQDNCDCALRVNGICTTEDIGGVMTKITPDGGGNGYLYLKNYNDFVVTVLLQIANDCGDSGLTDHLYNLILQPSEEMSVNLPLSCSPAYYAIEGIIVRKLAE